MLWEEQAGFHHGCSCPEQILTLHNIIKQCIKFQRLLVITFIDFRKAFDSIHRDFLWNICRRQKIPDQFINIFKNHYHNSSCYVKIDSGATNLFNFNTGVRQGCILSAFLFLLTIDFAMRKAMNRPKAEIPWKNSTSLTDLDFADVAL